MAACCAATMAACCAATMAACCAATMIDAALCYRTRFCKYFLKMAFTCFIVFGMVAIDEDLCKYSYTINDGDDR